MQVYSSYDIRSNRQYYKKRKNKKIYIFLAIFLLIAGFVFWAIIRTPEEQTAPVDLAKDQTETQAPAQATILSITGELKKQTETDWQSLYENEKIDVGDTLLTSKDSRAVVQLPDNSLIRLDANTEIKIIELSLADIVIEQLAGQAFHRVKTQTAAIYRVKNGPIELTALGTGFNTKITGDALTLVVTESRVKAKVYDKNQLDNILDMRTIDEGTQATIDLTKSGDKLIVSQKTEVTKLQEDTWLQWNKEEDEKGGFFLGIFGDNLKLNITEPEKLEFETAEEKITIKGTTETDAKVYISGEEVANKEGTFEKEIALTAGDNTIDVSVEKDTKKNKKTLYIKCTKTLDGKIDLTAEIINENTVKLTWKVTDATVTDGFRLLKGTTENPTFPDNQYRKASATTLSDSWENLENNTYHFRVCLYENQTCGLYSNDASVEIKKSTVNVTSASQILLKGSNQDQEVSLNWDILNLEGFESVKVLINTAADPTYPANSSHSLSAQARSDSWKSLQPGNYHFRVCAFSGNQCLLYSNDLPVTVTQTVISTQPGQITLSGIVNANQVTLNWTTKNLGAGKGYYAVYAETPNPTFPSQNFKLLSSAMDSSVTFSNLTSGKTYHFRICENINLSCGVYSNDVTLTLP